MIWADPGVSRRYRALLSRILHRLSASSASAAPAVATACGTQCLLDAHCVGFGACHLGLFEIAWQYLRSYTLNHTTNRVDVELGDGLFNHFTLRNRRKSPDGLSLISSRRHVAEVSSHNPYQWTELITDS
jgi:hypothetical protein